MIRVPHQNMSKTIKLTGWREMDLMILEKVDRVITGQHCIASLGITGVTRPSLVVITRSSLSQYHIGQKTTVEQNKILV